MCITGKLIDEGAVVASNNNVGPRLWVMRLQAPQIAKCVQPGQFIHMRIPGMDDHPLRRPFSVYAANALGGTIDLLYQTVGYGSTKMTGMVQGDECMVIGPVGHGWEVPEEASKVMLVGGGVGAAPLFMLTQECVKKGLDVTVILGAATKDAMVTLERYTKLLEHEPLCATDDGTYGYSGFATGPVQEELQKGGYDWVATCGPTPLMRIVANMAHDAGVPCSVSMEKHMACGIGACLGCIVDTVDGNKRSCVDGPVFDAEKVVW